jgi:nicotinate-nucleotide pyrophosphorylase
LNNNKQLAKYIMLYKQYLQIPHQISKDLIYSFLEEDSPSGDKTGDAIFDNNEKASAFVKVKSNTVLSGIKLLDLFFDDSTKITYYHEDGDLIESGTNVCLIEGYAAEILKKERIFLNLIQRMSGIAFSSYLMAENFSPEDTFKAVKIIRNHEFGKNIYIESSGGIDLSNLDEYVPTGVDAISSGSITHSVKSADISLDFK